MEYRDFQDCKSILCDTVIVDNDIRLLSKPTEIYNAKSQPEWMQILKITYRDFPGGPMVKTALPMQGAFNPCSENEILHAATKTCHSQINKNKNHL